MIVQFISAIALAVLAVLFCWAAFRTLKRPMPKYLFPAVAAISVIGYGVYSEYTWADRTVAQLPETIKVVHELPSRSVFSPWSYIIPRTDRLSLVDLATVRRNEALPDHVLTELLLMQRFTPVIRVPQMVDCLNNKRTDVTSNADFGEDGLPTNAQWEDLAENHPLISVLCG